MITPQEFYEFVRDHSDGLFRKGAYPEGEDHPAIILVLFTDGEIVLINAQEFINAGASKNAIAMIHKKSIHVAPRDGTSVIASIYISEAWMKSMTKEEAKSHVPGTSLEGDPNAYDVLLFSVLTQNFQAIMACKIAPDRLSIERTPFRIANAGELKGRFVANRPAMH